MPSFKQVYKQEPISDDQHVINFGKYQNWTIADVLEHDPQYLIWLHNNNAFFELDYRLFERAEGMNDDNINNFQNAIDDPHEFLT